MIFCYGSPSKLIQILWEHNPLSMVSAGNMPYNIILLFNHQRVCCCCSWNDRWQWIAVSQQSIFISIISVDPDWSIRDGASYISVLGTGSERLNELFKITQHGPFDTKNCYFNELKHNTFHLHGQVAYHLSSLKFKKNCFAACWTLFQSP